MAIQTTATTDMINNSFATTNNHDNNNTFTTTNNNYTATKTRSNKKCPRHSKISNDPVRADEIKRYYQKVLNAA